MNALPRFQDGAADRLFHFTDQADLMSPTLIITALLDPHGLTPADGFIPPYPQRATMGQNRLRMAWQFCKVGEVDAARYFARQSLRLDAKLSGAHELLAWLDLADPNTKERPSRIERATFHGQKATELNPTNAAAWVLLARAQVLSGNWRAVQESAGTALSLGLPDPSTARQILENAEVFLRRNPLET
jgi:hypothetical protein